MSSIIDTSQELAIQLFQSRSDYFTHINATYTFIASIISYLMKLVSQFKRCRQLHVDILSFHVIALLDDIDSVIIIYCQERALSIINSQIDC